MSYIQFPDRKVKKMKKKVVKLPSFPRNHDVLLLFSQLRYLNNIDDTEFQRELISIIRNNDHF